MAMILIGNLIRIPEQEIQLEFVRASGPGGQNVNKVATAVQLRFDLGRSASLSEDVRRRAMKLAGSRLTDGGMVVIDARRFRSQELNRQDALERLADLLQRAMVSPMARVRTKPTKGSQIRRLESKKRRAQIKQGRHVGRTQGEDG